MKDDFSTVELPSETNNWFRPKESGDYQIRIVSSHHKVDKWWAGADGEWNGQKIVAGRPYLYSPETEDVPMELVKIETFKNQDGSEYDRVSVNNGYAWLVINRKENCVQVWEVFQKGILRSLQKFAKIKGSLQGYDITITREGTGLSTRWSVIALDSSLLSKKDKELIENNEIKLADIYNKEGFNDKAKIDRLAPEPMKNKMTKETDKINNDIPF